MRIDRRRKPSHMWITVDFLPAWPRFSCHQHNAATALKRCRIASLRTSGLSSVWTEPSMASSRSRLARHSLNFAARPFRSFSHDEISSTMVSRPLKRQMMSSKSVLVKKSRLPRSSKAQNLLQLLLRELAFANTASAQHVNQRQSIVKTLIPLGRLRRSRIDRLKDLTIGSPA